METTSRGRRPRATKPRATWRTRSPRSRTTWRNRRGRVSWPRTVPSAASAGRGGDCVSTLISDPPSSSPHRAKGRRGAAARARTSRASPPDRHIVRRAAAARARISRPSRSSSPHLLALPATGAADARVLDAEIELLDVVLLEQARAGVLHHDAPHLQHVAVVSEVEGHVGVLLHEEDGHALLAVDAADDLEDVLDELGREAEGGLVEKHHLGPGHEGAADGEHLLLASGQRARALLGPAPENGEVVIDHLEVAADPLHVLPRVRAHLEILAHAQEGKHFAPLGHVGEPQAHDAVG